MKLIFDIFRWMIGLLIVLIASELVFAGTLYFFEFIARTLDHWKSVPYFIVWLILIEIVLVIFNLFAVYIFKIMALVVRQRISFTNVSAILLFILICGVLISFWTNYMKFSWEELNHKTANKILFSIYYVTLLYIPVILIGSAVDEK